MSNEDATKITDRIMIVIKNALIAGHNLTHKQLEEIESSENPKINLKDIEQEWIDYLIKIN